MVKNAAKEHLCGGLNSQRFKLIKSMPNSQRLWWEILHLELFRLFTANRNSAHANTLASYYFVYLEAIAVQFPLWHSILLFPPIGWLFCIASQYLTNIFDLWVSEKNYLTTICFTFAPGIEDTFSSFAYLLVNSEFCALLKVFLSVWFKYVVNRKFVCPCFLVLLISVTRWRHLFLLVCQF